MSELSKWYDARDLIVERDFLGAKKAAVSCCHPDAVWFLEVMAERDTLDLQVLRERGAQGDARALCFLWLCCDDQVEEMELLRSSARLGYAFAQGLLLANLEASERFPLAEACANQGERMGLFWLGRAFMSGWGCEKNDAKARSLLLSAAEMGDTDAMSFVVECLYKEDDPQRWRWWGALARKNAAPFVFFTGMVDLVRTGSRPACLFEVGRALKGHLDEIYRYENEECLEEGEQAVAFYDSQILACRKAVNCWTLIGIRFHVVRDVRILIARLVWNARGNAEYS